jgi:hypothetical protein
VGWYGSIPTTEGAEMGIKKYKAVIKSNVEVGSDDEDIAVALEDIQQALMDAVSETEFQVYGVDDDDDEMESGGIITITDIELTEE